MTKTVAAFRLTADRLFDRGRVYFWTLTFTHVKSDWEGSRLFGRFLNHLREVIGREGWGGVRVVELHKEHGVHYHMLVTERLAVDLVRRVGRCYGIGRIEVQRADRGSGPYLAKYLSKRRQGPITESGRSMRRWAAFGDVERVRIRDLVNDCPMWVYRRKHGLHFLTYRWEAILSRCWDHGPEVFKAAWYVARKGECPGDVVKLAEGRLEVRGLGVLVDRPEWAVQPF